MASGNSILERVYSMEGGPEECCDVYADWAETYDKDTLDGFGYVGPRIAAEKLNEHASADAVVLDAGCGTGLAGAELSRLGFCTIDGVDISEEMLAVAGEKNVYRKLATADMTAPLELPGNSYDGAICVGVFTNGHVGPKGLDELVRIVRPGCPVVATVHENVWETDGYPEHLATLESRGLARVKEAAEAAYHENAGYRCRMLVLEAA